MPYDAPAGPTIGLVGRVPAHVSPSRLPGKVVALMTPDTSGRTGFGSLKSAGLAAALVSRLQARTSGSILWRLTWKISITPSHRLTYRLRASPARISASDLSGWPTPTTPSGGQTTPPGTSATGRRPDGSKATVTLQGVAVMAGWPTPMAGSAGTEHYNPAGNTDSSRRTVALLSGWPTPRATDSDKNLRSAEGAAAEIARKGTPQDLIQAAQMAGWATTTTRDWRSDRGQLTSEELYGSKGQPLARQALYSDATGSSVTTPKSGLLSAEHSRWLLRLPPAWDDCMVTAMPSTRKRSRSS